MEMNAMQKKDDTPLWVFLAFSSIETRKSALLLIWACVLFTLYSVPWVLFIKDQPWVEKIFLIDDWSWVLMMIPLVIWYLLSLRWVDRNAEWG
jgi:hypothetical protein